MSGAAGIDISSIETTTIPPGSTKHIQTGLATEFSPDLYLRLAPRSSHATKGIFLNGGVIDSDYRGEIQVILHNASTIPFQIASGDRIAQGIFEKFAKPQLILENNLTPTVRNKGGFGSTGNKRIQLCPINDTTIIQLDQTRGPNKIRARRLNRTLTTNILQPQRTPEETIPTTSNQTNVHPKPKNTDTSSTETQSTDQSTVDDVSVSFEMETDDVEDPPIWIEPAAHPHPSASDKPEDDDNIEELYSDFPEDYCLPTTTQRTTALPPAPEETNLEPSSTPPVLPTTTATLPSRTIEERPNSSLPKKLNITKDRLLQSIGHVNPDKLIKLLPHIMKENTIHIQMDSNPRIDLGKHATLQNTHKSY